MIVSQFESTLDAYSEERAILVKALVSLAKPTCEVGYLRDKEVSIDTSFVVFINFPTGQVSFHIKEKWVEKYFYDLDLFPYEWDKHTREERNERLVNLV